MTTKDEIRSWLEEAKKNGSTHVIVMCDGIDLENFPIFVFPGKTPRIVASNYVTRNGDAYRVMEVYSMRKDIEIQLSEHRAFHWD